MQFHLFHNKNTHKVRPFNDQSMKTLLADVNQLQKKLKGLKTATIMTEKPIKIIEGAKNRQVFCKNTAMFRFV